MKVFISGPMSRKPNYNRAAFFKAEEELERKGYSVWNPAWLAYPSNTEFSEYDMRSIDFTALDHCDAIYMLKGWQYSKGAKAEFEYAKIHGKQILRENDPTTDPMLHDSVYGLTAAKFDNFVKDPRVAKPLDDCFSIYDYIGPKLEKEVNNVNQAINDVEADLDNFKDETDGKMDDIYNTLHRHGENIDTCQNDIDTCLNDMDCLRRICNNRHADNVNKINALKKEVEAIKESIGTDNLQEQLEKDFADVYEGFQNTKDQVNDINMGYIKWSSEVSQFDERIEKLEENMKESYKHLNNADEALERRIKAIEKRLNIKPFYEPTEDEKDDD